MSDEAQRQEVTRNPIERLSISIDVSRSADGFFLAYAATVGRPKRLETAVNGSRSKGRAISYALAELAVMFDREGTHG